MTKILQKNIVSCLIAGLLLILSWPPFSLTPFLFVAFVPLFRTLDSDHALIKRWRYAYLTLFIWSLGTMYWIGNTKINFQGLVIMMIAWLCIPLFQSLPVLIFLWLKRTFDTPKVWFVLPFLWVVYEYLHSQWQLSFTWLNLGLGLSPTAWFIQFYELTGYLGGTFFIMTVNVLIYLACKEFRSEHFRRYIYLLTGAFVLVAIVNFILYPGSGKAANTKKVAIIQPNTDPYEVLDNNSLKRQVGILQQMTSGLAGQKVDLVVLSEGYLRSIPATPMLLNDTDGQPVVKAIKRISKAVNAPILVGCIGFKLFGSVSEAPASALPTGDGRYFSVYNAALLIAHDQPTQVQMKNKLVPFMERIPYLRQFAFFEKFKLRLNQTKVSYDMDNAVNVFTYKDMKIGTLICLDALYTDYAADFVLKGANVMAIIANDGWAGKTSGYTQNAQYASVVAASLRRNVVRSATTGKSMFVNEAGTKSQVTNWAESTVIVEDVNLYVSNSLYVKYGDWFGLLSLIAIASYTIYLRMLVRKS